MPAAPVGIPLHTMTYSTVSGPKRLIDDFAVSFVPSGRVLISSLDSLNTLDCRQPKYVGFAYASGDILFPESEVEYAATAFGNRGQPISGDKATRTACTQNWLATQFLHFACHASKSGDSSPAMMCLGLSDGLITEADVLATKRFGITRLVVLSACRTGEADARRGLNENISLANWFLVAGSAGAIATMRRVDDWVSWIVISRFYDELMQGDATPCGRDAPAHALSRTLQWLATATQESIIDYIRERPLLQNAWTAFLRRLPETADQSLDRLTRDKEWNAFVLVGC